MQLLVRVAPEVYRATYTEFDAAARYLQLSPPDRNIAWRERTADKDWHEWPVPAEAFVTDPFHVGNAVHVRPKILEFIGDFMDPGELYETAIFVAGIGSGKSYAAGLLLLYSLYVLGCMREPHKYLSTFPGVDIASDSEIAVITASAAGARQASKVIYQDVVEKVDNSPWFRRYFDAYPGKGSELDFPRRIRFAPGTSQARSVLGLNVFAFAVDEAAFGVAEGDDYVNTGSVKALFEQLNTRRRSRFSRLGWGGLFSSPQSESTYVEAIAVEGRRAGTQVMVRRLFTWEAKNELRPGVEVFLLDHDPERPRVVRQKLIYLEPGLAQDPATGELVRFGPLAGDAALGNKAARESILRDAA